MTKFPLNDAANWVEAYGSPLYVYDAKTIRGQYFRMKHAFDQDIDVDIHYAYKALNNLNILKLKGSNACTPFWVTSVRPIPSVTTGS